MFFFARLLHMSLDFFVKEAVLLAESCFQNVHVHVQEFSLEEDASKKGSERAIM